MINSQYWNAAVKQHRRAAIGADVEIEESMSREVEIGPEGRRQIFPFYICRWRVGDTRHSVLLRPVLRERLERGTLWFPARTVYEVDDAAMYAQIRRLVAATQIAPLPASPSLNIP